MTRPLSPGRAVAVWLLGAAAAGCGAKAPPQAPLIIAPDRVGQLEVSRLDDLVYVAFEVPSSDTTGDLLADIVRVDVYALTTQPAEGEQEEFSEDWLEAATLVDTIPVRPPLLPGMEEATEAAGDHGGPAREDEPVPARQGDEITVVERLGPEAFIPVTVGEEDEEDEDDEDEDDEDDAEENRPIPLPNAAPPLPPPVIRSYIAFGVSSRGREGLPSRAAIPLVDPPGPPPAPAVEYTETGISVIWEAPDTLRLPVQSDDYDVGDDSEPPLESTPIVEWGEPSQYVVYDVAGLGVASTARPERLGPPQREESHSDVDVVFGETRCYAVRVLDAVGQLEIEGPESPAICIVLTDTFAPAAPTGVIAVADDDAINLVWDANGESDVVGYLILRGSAPDATLQPLTPEPVERTTYRDARLEPGQRYWYSVQAVDSAVPPNLSPPSEPIAESAR